MQLNSGQNMFKKPKIAEILVATDLSENADRAMDYALSMAEVYGARITVLHVVEKAPPNAEMLVSAILGYENIDEYRQKSEKELVSRIKAYLEKFCSKVADQMVNNCRLIFKDILVEPGNAAERIIHHAEAGGYHVLVMGNRGLSLFQEVFMGGTSRKVLNSCRIPVLIVPGVQIASG